jgi:predicted acylesterase/phospholipase RssA
MKIGICLTGGGAKGAFQGGFLKALIEGNLIPEVFSGTSIGAVNLYYMLHACHRELEEFWVNMELDQSEIKPGWVFDNSQIINKLNTLGGDEEKIKAAYVNFVNIEDKKLKEVIVDIKTLNKEAALLSVKYSSLLPSRPEDYVSEDNGKGEFNSKNAFDNFRDDLNAGIYDGYNLDGGILNNNLLQPLINEELDKLILVALSDKFTPPEYLFKNFEKENILIIKPDIEIKPSDTIRFEKDFCKDLYERGYKIGKETTKELI